MRARESIQVIKVIYFELSQPLVNLRISFRLGFCSFSLPIMVKSEARSGCSWVLSCGGWNKLSAIVLDVELLVNGDFLSRICLRGNGSNSIWVDIVLDLFLLKCYLDFIYDDGL